MSLVASLLLTLDPTDAPPAGLPPSTRFSAPAMSPGCCFTFPSTAATTPSSPYLMNLGPDCPTRFTAASPPYLLYNNRFFFFFWFISCAWVVICLLVKN